MVPSDARQMHMGPHLGPPLPPHANVLPGRAFPGAGEHAHSCLIAFPACLKECEWALTARVSFIFLSLSQLWLLTLRAHRNSCPATGAHSQAKYSQVVCRHSTYATICNTLWWKTETIHAVSGFIQSPLLQQRHCCIDVYLISLYYLSVLFRMEMNAILHQKELENAHHKGLMGMDNPMSYPSNHMAFRGRQRMPDGHDVFVHRPTLDELHSSSILMSASPYPPISTLHRERGRRAGRRPTAHKSAESHVANLKGQTEDKSVEQSPGATSGEEKEVEAKGDLGEECATGKTHHQAKIDSELATGSRKNYKEGEPGLRKACVNSQDGCSDGANSGTNDKDISSQCSAFQEKFIYPSTGGALTGMPYMFPVPGNGFLPPGGFRKQKIDYNKSYLHSGHFILTSHSGWEDYISIWLFST